jgi:hypothetical protein
VFTTRRLGQTGGNGLFRGEFDDSTGQCYHYYHFSTKLRLHLTLVVCPLFPSVAHSSLTATFWNRLFPLLKEMRQDSFSGEAFNGKTLQSFGKIVPYSMDGIYVCLMLITYMDPRACII